MLTSDQGKLGWMGRTVSNKVIAGASFMLAGGLIAHGITLLAQTMMTAPGKYISRADVLRGLESGTSSTLGVKAGQSMEIVPNLVVRRRLDGPNNASIHSKETDGVDATEIMEITDGSGTLMTGGSWIEPSEAKSKDRTLGIKGGEVHDVQPGDFIVIPPGTAHWFSKINGHITLVETRFPGNIMKKK